MNLIVISYSFVEPLRRRFATKTLWILEDAWTDMLWLTVFGIGSINKNFKKKAVILPLMAIEEIFEMCIYGLRRVIPAEIDNESMDYCEWKNGYRTEAMASVAKGIAAKVSSNTSLVVTTALKKLIGYEANAFRLGVEQTDKVKFYLFAMFTIIPTVTGSLGIIPMLFYDLDNKKKEKMYAELLERRLETANKASSGILSE